ncbi:protein ALP1-like [Rosa chinensis]|nr:protein ALP1-like [Rosa chinensis]
MRISKEYLKLQSSIIGSAEREKWKWFENCLGALDGTHIPVTVSAEERPRYRNRKGDISTNVLGVCAPDLKFIYVLPGWEGSASDARVLRDALRRNNRLHVQRDKYFLVDAGYTNGPGFLAPYRGTRYHLNEWTGNRPENYKELYNLRHSIARNVIERSFGLLKKRWSIMRTPSFFSIKTQVRIINACCVLHNFIRIEQASDPVLEDQDSRFLVAVDLEILNRPTSESNANNLNDRITSVQATEQWTNFRDTFALKMFQDYQARHAT